MLTITSIIHQWPVRSKHALQIYQQVSRKNKSVSIGRNSQVTIRKMQISTAWDPQITTEWPQITSKIPNMRNTKWLVQYSYLHCNQLLPALNMTFEFPCILKKPRQGQTWRDDNRLFCLLLDNGMFSAVMKIVFIEVIQVFEG